MTEASHLAQLELVCFGPLKARLDGKDPPPDVVWRKHLGLLTYLALSPDRTRARDHLLGLLWPEKPEPQARHSLNEAVRRLRAGLGAERLLTRGDAITLNDDRLDVDVIRFGALANEKPKEAAELLRGEFLEGFALDDAPGFEDWVTRERTRWHARGVAVLVALAEAALQKGRLADAEEASLRALAIEPHAEAAVRIRLRAMTLQGDALAALDWYHQFAERLSRDLGERPSRELEALAERIRTRSWHPAGASAATEETTPPFVGHEAAKRTTFEVLAAAIAGAPRTVAIIGGLGLGKSRLLAECLARAGLEGALTVQAAPLASDYDAQWSTLRALARAGLTSLPGSAGTDPAALAVLGAVVAERADRIQGVDHGEMASALARLLAAVAEERPLVVAIDDAHFADGATLTALGAAMAGFRSARMALLFTCVPEVEHGPPALMRLRGEVGLRLKGASVRLQPLVAADIDQLVGGLAPWCADPERRQRLSRRVMFETGGSPFFAVTLLQALSRASTMREDVLMWPRPGSTIDGPLPISMPDLVRMAVVARVSSLEPQDLQLLRAASVGGSALDHDLLRETSGLEGQALEDGLARLERAGFLRFDGDRYALAAPLMAEVVRRECLTPGQQRALRQRAARALAPRRDMEARVLRIELLAELEPGDALVDDALGAAQQALEAGATRGAHRALAAADRMVEAGADHSVRDRIAALRRRLDTIS